MADMREKHIDTLMHLGDHIRQHEKYELLFDTPLVKAIEFVLDMLKNGVTVQEWISVKDGLPKDNERVLVYHDDGMIRFGISKGGFADVVSSLYLKHNHRTCFSKVTHWMPLPQPPKGE